MMVGQERIAETGSVQNRYLQTMKLFLYLLIAALLGGIVATVIVKKLSPDIAVNERLGPAYLRTGYPTLVNKSTGGDSNLTVTPPNFDFRAAARLATPAVVHISAREGKAPEGDDPLAELFGGGTDPFERGGSGSGVIYTNDGFIVTNYHVVEGAGRLQVTLFDNRTFRARVIGKDEKSDLAVIKIDATDLPTLTYADSDAAEIGEWVLAVGNPLDLTSTVTAGIISAKGRSLRLLSQRDAIESFIQTDAAVNPGNSGGALVDASGRLLGINTAIATRTGLFQGYSFAIPVNLVRRIVDDIVKTGSYQRAFLGVEIYPLNAREARRLDVPITQGVVIDRVSSGGSADRAGLRQNDIILQVDTRPILDLPDLTEIIGRTRVDDRVRLRIFRDGKEEEVLVRMYGVEE